MITRESNRQKILESATNKIVMSKILKLYEPLWNGIEEALSSKKTLVIAIDGHSTSGKTTLAYLIEVLFDAQIFHMDDFFRSNKQGKSQHEYASNIDFDRFQKEVLGPLSNKQSIVYKAFNCKTQTFMPKILKEFRPITVIEGAYSTHPKISNLIDIKVFLKSSYLKQILKVKRRNGMKNLGMFIKKWIPMERAYFKEYKVELESDYVFKSI